MTAIVSSTIWPSSEPIHGGVRSVFSVEERATQTADTVRSLRALGIDRVVVADNSERLPDTLPGALNESEIIRIPGLHFQNKGISEAWLIASLVGRIALRGPLLKVSGRYTVGALPAINWSDVDIAGCYSDSLLTTRCFAIRNSHVLGALMQSALREMYAYPTRIVGPRSLLRIVRSSLFPGRHEYPYHDPTISLEMGCTLAIRHNHLRFSHISSFGVKGVFGGGASAGQQIVE